MIINSDNVTLIICCNSNEILIVIIADSHWTNGHESKNSFHNTYTSYTWQFTLNISVNQVHFMLLSFSIAIEVF